MSKLDLRVGDQVYWTDPDNGECSGYFIIKEIWQAKSSDIFFLENEHGSELEAFRHELS